MVRGLAKCQTSASQTTEEAVWWHEGGWKGKKLRKYSNAEQKRLVRMFKIINQNLWWSKHFTSIDLEIFFDFFLKIFSENFIYSMLESREGCTTLSGIVYRIIISLKLFLLTHCYRCYISCLQWSQLMLWFIYCPCCYIHL